MKIYHNINISNIKLPGSNQHMYAHLSHILCFSTSRK